MSEEDNKYKPSEEYEQCLEQAIKLSDWEQINLSTHLLNNFYKKINNKNNS